MKSKAFFIVLSIALALTSCRKDTYYVAPAPNPTDTVYFKTEIQPLFDSECASCHDGSVPPDLTAANSYNELLTGNAYVTPFNPNASLLYQRMVSASSPMPPGGVLTTFK
jgi:hypothetical protein